MSLINSTISGNSAGSGGGGGIYTSGGISLINSTVSNNSAQGGGGGTRSRGDVSLTNSTVSGNSAGGGGGGILTILFSDVSLTNSTVSGNSTNGGGGGIYSGRAVSLTNSTVSGNSAGGDGGGIRSRLGGVSLKESTVLGNSTGNNGGGIFGNSTGVILTNSTVSGNSANGSGGGIYSVNAVSLTNSTVSGNSANGSGGGISGFRGDVDLNNSTIAFNTAGSIGGGVSLKALFGTTTNTFTNSIIANNTAPTGSEVGIIRNTQSFNISNSLILSTAGMDNGSSGVPLNGVNGNIVGIDPRLAPLANNGGPTQTHAFLAGSPAIDAGGTTALTTDQRGFARLFGAGVDMGAFEFGAVDPNPMVSPTTPTTTATATPTTLATQALAALGFDFTPIRQFWTDPIEETEALTDELEVERACASIPELELEPDDDGDTAEGELTAASAKVQAELDENCLPIFDE